ncbi:MAG: hypothetical protein RBR28_08795 [Lentimicrobium sp.]|jgi:regulator of replication initiation timing|nr:hypothetical protein [Lentimicrobium sp.]
MKNAETLITGIAYKVRKLIEINERLTFENQQLREEIKSIKSKVNLFDNNINTLQNQITTLKLAKSLNKEESRTNVKLRINELVREIDHCIAILNHK